MDHSGNGSAQQLPVFPSIPWLLYSLQTTLPKPSLTIEYYKTGTFEIWLEIKFQNKPNEASSSSGHTARPVNKAVTDWKQKPYLQMGLKSTPASPLNDQVDETRARCIYRVCFLQLPVATRVMGTRVKHQDPIHCKHWLGNICNRIPFSKGTLLMGVFDDALQSTAHNFSIRGLALAQPLSGPQRAEACVSPMRTSCYSCACSFVNYIKGTLYRRYWKYWKYKQYWKYT